MGSLSSLAIPLDRARIPIWHSIHSILRSRSFICQCRCLREGRVFAQCSWWSKKTQPSQNFMCHYSLTICMHLLYLPWVWPISGTQFSNSTRTSMYERWGLWVDPSPWTWVSSSCIKPRVRSQYLMVVSSKRWCILTLPLWALPW